MSVPVPECQSSGAESKDCRNPQKLNQTKAAYPQSPIPQPRPPPQKPSRCCGCCTCRQQVAERAGSEAAQPFPTMCRNARGNFNNSDIGGSPRSLHHSSPYHNCLRETARQPRLAKNLRMIPILELLLCHGRLPFLRRRGKLILLHLHNYLCRCLLSEADTDRVTYGLSNLSGHRLSGSRRHAQSMKD